MKRKKKNQSSDSCFFGWESPKAIPS